MWDGWPTFAYLVVIRGALERQLRALDIDIDRAHCIGYHVRPSNMGGKLQGGCFELNATR